MNPPRLVIAGGSGFIGGELASAFSARGFAVCVLTRSPRARRDSVREVAWNGVNSGPWAVELEGADAVINLAGKSVNCPHTPANLHEITASRVYSVNAIAAAMERLQRPPRVWVQAGAVGYYGDTGQVLCDESSPAGNDVLAAICRQWEAAFASVRLEHTRKVTLRIGVVLGRDGGALPVLAGMTRWFLGGAAGNGRQYLSWIHLADLMAMFITAVSNDSISGQYNAVGPKAVTNAEFMRELRRVLHRPWSPPAPELAVKLGARMMGAEGSLALVSQRCEPKRFLAAGFQFQYPDLAAALQDLCQRL